MCRVLWQYMLCGISKMYIFNIVCKNIIFNIIHKDKSIDISCYSTLNFKTYCNSKPLQLPPIPPHSSAFTQVYPLCGACSSCYQSCHTLLFTNFSRTWTILKIYHLHILFLVLVLILILKADGNLFEVRDPISHWKVHSPWQTC